MSPSQICMLQSCGERYRRAYLLGEPRGSSIALEFGSLGHAAIEWALQDVQQGLKMPTGEALAAVQLATLSRFNDEAVLAQMSDASRVDPEALADEVKRSLAVTLDWIKSQRLEPVLVEQRLVDHIEVDGVDVGLLMYPDLVARYPSGRLAVLDWKFPGRAPTRMGTYYGAKAGDALAGVLYARALHKAGYPVRDIEVLYTTRTRNPRACLARLRASRRRLDDATTLASSAIRSILRESFTLNPASNLCRPAYCSFYATCPGGRIKE